QALIYSSAEEKYDRDRRFLFDLINLGVTAAMTGLAGRNALKIAQIEARMDYFVLVLGECQKQVQVTSATAAFLENGMMKLTEELNGTQGLLNDTIHVLEDTRLNVRHINASVDKLSIKFGDFKQDATETLLYLSVNEILNNKLNLLFIRQQEISKVVQQIFRESNISYNSLFEEQSSLQAITELLYLQHITFVSTNMYNAVNKEVGRLIFTTVVALPNIENDKFSVFQLPCLPSLSLYTND
ncbi:unnamed protein product, partial [Didymodactylos carnosus]